MKRNVFYLIGIILLMVSCYPDDTMYYDDTDLVYTNYTETFDFAGKGFYAMPDKIVKVTSDLADGQTPEYLQEPYNTQILNMIKDNMTALGWTKVEDPANADLTLFPAVWSNTTVVYWYDYWCGYYYYCGWGWYYPSYSTYTTGTMVMGLAASGGDYIEPSIVWAAAINGLISGSFDATRINNAINQAYKQTPYLDTK